MAMTFRRAGSVGCVAVWLLTAIGCSVGTISEGEEGEIKSTTQALGCDPTPIVGVCQGQCTNDCTNGSAIASCMTACIGVYCGQQMQFHADPNCTNPNWEPPLAEPPLEAERGCDSYALMTCYKGCDLCKPPTGDARPVCSRNCMVTYCSGEPEPSCADVNGPICNHGCVAWGTSDYYYYCFATCITAACGSG